ncbi:ABC transporter [Streptomyces sp. NBC_00847]|uniref:ABC transporter n=1 Tax=Streptomyces sp. NBC_00847 TaxID=2975850 RepID=UPI0022507AFE|nr:ABC transporter [Streptomyces sp. NBC_00847]MCX4881834.1 ABC transporter [Streptomyces sp. NBC_00847]
MRVTRELAFPVLRTLPWRAMAAGGGLGLVIAGVQRLAGGEPDAWPTLVLLRSAILAHALGLAFLLDDPARHTTATVPVRRPLRTTLRLGYAVALTALWWTALLLLVPSEVRPPLGGITLEAATACVLAPAAGALAVRLTDEPRPGPSVAATVLFTAVIAPLSLPDRWALFVSAQDDRWGAAHTRWAWLLAGSMTALALSMPEPLRGRPLPFRRGPASSSRAGV